MIIRARLKTQELNGINVTSQLIGTEYLVDLSTKQQMLWVNTGEPESIPKLIELVMIIDEEVMSTDQGRFIPLELLQLIY